jgi:hypothetical protein
MPAARTVGGEARVQSQSGKADRPHHHVIENCRTEAVSCCASRCGFASVAALLGVELSADTMPADASTPAGCAAVAHPTASCLGEWKAVFVMVMGETVRGLVTARPVLAACWVMFAGNISTMPIGRHRLTILRIPIPPHL